MRAQREPPKFFHLNLNSSKDFMSQLCDHSETNPCFDKSLCQIDIHGAVSCQSCPPGFKGDGISCYPVDYGNIGCRVAV